MHDIRLRNSVFAKKTMHERSDRAGRMEFRGSLAELGKRANWNQSDNAISLDRRLTASGDLTASNVEHARKILAGSYVACRPNVSASVRCIDGRLAAGYDDASSVIFTQKMGPQIPGGTVIDAVAYSIAIGEKARYAPTNLNDSIDTVAACESSILGYLPADHVDDHQLPGRTGCRAVDGIEIHLLSVVDSTKIAEVKANVELLLGDSFRQSHFNQVVESTLYLIKNIDTYLPTVDDIPEKLKLLNPEGAPVLVGKHQEIVVGINLVEAETLHRDHFSSQLGSNIQAFGYDAWYTFKVAAALFPVSKTTSKYAQQTQLNLRSMFVHARFALAITALMDLSDGSLLLAIRMPTGIT